MKNNKLVLSALFTALICVSTMMIKIPTPLGGYINLGDSLILLSVWVLPVQYSVMAAGIGSAFADLLSGYVLYAPATLIIKGIMAFVAGAIYKKQNKNFSLLASAAVAELIMVIGYYAFEGFIYGFGASLINIPANAIQGVASIIISLLILKIYKKIRL